MPVSASLLLISLTPIPPCSLSTHGVHRQRRSTDAFLHGAHKQPLTPALLKQPPRKWEILRGGHTVCVGWGGKKIVVAKKGVRGEKVAPCFPYFPCARVLAHVSVAYSLQFQQPSSG